MFYTWGSVQQGLPGRRSGCLQWLHCGFAGGRPGCCSCIAGEGTVGHTPVGASPSSSGEMTENNKEIKVRGRELGSPCSFIVIHGMPSPPAKTQSPLQSTEELDGFAYRFWLFWVSYNACSRARAMNTRGISTLKCSTFWTLSPIETQPFPLQEQAGSECATGRYGSSSCTTWNILPVPLFLQLISKPNLPGKPLAQLSAPGWYKGKL